MNWSTDVVCPRDGGAADARVDLPAPLPSGDDAIPALIIGLQAKEPATRRNAAEVLGFIQSARAVNALLRVAQQDPDATVRQEAVWALGEIGEPRVRLSLRAISRSDPSSEVRLEALRASLRLGEIF